MVRGGEIGAWVYGEALDEVSNLLVTGGGKTWRFVGVGLFQVVVDMLEFDFRGRSKIWVVGIEGEVIVDVLVVAAMTGTSACIYARARMSVACQC